ncbi:MAG: CBS domain-containing protein [Methanomicrobiaceae archaeon]|nr:CBS domain-containing protein [Methanomicrobiaceae archaeon]
MNKKMLVRDMMSKPVTIAKSAAITEAFEKMLDEEVDPLIVTNNGAVMGTISRKAIADTLGSSKLGLKKPSGVIAPAQLHVAKRTDEEFTSVYPDENAEILIPLLQEYKLVVVLDEEHRLIGQVKGKDLLKSMQPATSLVNVLQAAYTIRSDERVVHLRRRMLDEDISKFVVMDDNGILGIVTETDVARAMKAFREVVDDKYQDHRIRNLLVRDIMTTHPLTVGIDEEIKTVIELLLEKRISSIPVMKDGRLTGMVTTQSLLAAL